MRAHNFSAGPCTLPIEVLEEAAGEFVDYQGLGMSLMEMSHRSEPYEQVHHDAMELACRVFGAPDDFAVLFIQGGATLQFAMAPINLLGPGERAGYVVSGSWGKKALADGSHHGDLYSAWDGSSTNYTTMPADSEIALAPDTRYLHITSNETIHGVRFAEFPALDVRMVGDMSSDFMSRPIPWDRFDLVYGGVQKNLGPAGMAVVFVRKSAFQQQDAASYLRYDIHAAKDSLYNTPPVFSIWMMGKVLAWMEGEGGLAAMERRAQDKAALIYDTIDTSDGFYTCPVDAANRSLMNVVFRLRSEELEAEFLEQADKKQLLNLRGHRSVGGLRASLYNALPHESAEALVEHMDEFAAR